MMRKLIVAAAFAAFVTTAASATYSAPAGDTKAIARYTELQKRCGVVAVDKSGERWGFVQEATDEQYRQHLAVCAQQRHAANVSPAVYIGAGAAVGAAVVRAATRNNNRNDRDDRDGRGERRLTPEQREQLNALRAVESEEVLGARPENSRGYLGQRRAHQRVPRNCGEVKSPSPDGKTMYVRVTCR